MSKRMSKDEIVCRAREEMGYRGTELVGYPSAVDVPSEAPQRAATAGRTPPSPGFLIQPGIEEGLVTPSAKQSFSDDQLHAPEPVGRDAPLIGPQIPTRQRSRCVNDVLVMCALNDVSFWPVHRGDLEQVS
ncbi:hypothetical protein ARMSODRAFT_383303 [Armillaria solidipes]|uniref:Uncharacterized protein n=1 Tax=Armillaria solidipes TaxID=1076256 RepID=A0A2H3BQ45_9AGAR|nr:hypothetical protein ARMSODRAFT_383303 [Armillaria solidipes]